MMSPDQIDAAAAMLLQAELTGRQCGLLSLLYPAITLDDAYAVALRIRNQLSQLRVREHPHLRVSASIGVAAADPSFLSVKDWINAADSALYSAKDAGRDQVIPAAPLMAGSAPTRSGTDAGSEASRQAHQPEPDDTLI